MGAIDLRKILGFYLGQTLWKLDYGHFQIRSHFFQNNITSLIQFRMFFSKSENEVWIELKPDGCCCKNLKHYYSRKCTLNQSNEKILHFFCNKWHEKCSNSKFTFDFFTERDGLNGYFWLQFIEKGIISQMCNGFLFMNAWSWKSLYFSSEWWNFTHFRGTVHICKMIWSPFIGFVDNI